MQKVITMKKHTKNERESAIRDIEESPINPAEWEGPHETKVTAFRYVDNLVERKKKRLLSGFFDRIKAIIHPV